MMSSRQENFEACDEPSGAAPQWNRRRGRVRGAGVRVSKFEQPAAKKTAASGDTTAAQVVGRVVLDVGVHQGGGGAGVGEDAAAVVAGEVVANIAVGGDEVGVVGDAAAVAAGEVEPDVGVVELNRAVGGEVETAPAPSSPLAAFLSMPLLATLRTPPLANSARRAGPTPAS